MTTSNSTPSLICSLCLRRRPPRLVLLRLARPDRLEHDRPELIVEGPDEPLDGDGASLDGHLGPRPTDDRFQFVRTAGADGGGGGGGDGGRIWLSARSGICGGGAAVCCGGGRRTVCIRSGGGGVLGGKGGKVAFEKGEADSVFKQVGLGICEPGR